MTVTVTVLARRSRRADSLSLREGLSFWQGFHCDSVTAGGSAGESATSQCQRNGCSPRPARPGPGGQGRAGTDLGPTNLPSRYHNEERRKQPGLKAALMIIESTEPPTGPRQDTNHIKVIVLFGAGISRPEIRAGSALASGAGPGR